MKHWLPVLLTILVIIYLNRSYAFFYDNIGKYKLSSPYKEQSYTINNDFEKEPITLLTLGDSLTAGVGSTDIKKTYPYIIAQNLSNKHQSPVRLVNLSQPGAKTQDVINSQLPDILKYQPQFITLLIGINNIHNLTSLNSFEKDYEVILQKLTKTEAKIAVINIPYLGSYASVLFPYNFVLDYRTYQYNQTIYKLTEKYKISFTDLYSKSKKSFDIDNSLYSKDYFHPSEKGYLFWANVISSN